MVDISSLIGAAPPPDGVTPNFAHPQDVLHTINTVSGILTIGLVAPFVLARLYIRLFVARLFVTEDWFCLVAWLLATGYCLTGLFMGMHGGGNHDYEVTKSELRGFQQALYADTIVYGPTAWFTKATLLLIFARVFSPFKKTVIGIYIFIALMLGYYLPVMIIKIRVCTPIYGLWDPDVHAECINQSALFICDTIMSAVTDLAILILPIPLVWSLHMPTKKKVRIGLLLGAGGIATGASVVRLILVFQPNSFADETVSFVRFNLLGVAEVGIGLICASFPAFNMFFSKLSKDKNSSNQSKQIPPKSNQVRLERLRNSKDSRKNPVDSLLQSQNSYLQVESSKHERLSATQEENRKLNGNVRLIHVCACHAASLEPQHHRPAVYYERPWMMGSDMERGDSGKSGVRESYSDGSRV